VYYASNVLKRLAGMLLPHFYYFFFSPVVSHTQNLTLLLETVDEAENFSKPVDL
jgi:hypothetical protein